MSECKTIACVNQKGGVGKSVTSTNLGVGLARHGKSVLIVDCDSQASQTISLGWQENQLSGDLATLFALQLERKPCDPHEVILHHKEGVHLLPSSIALSGLELRMVNATSWEALLRKLLQPLKAGYDFIVLDCPPTLGMMTVNALAAADSLIVPVQPEFLSVVGMRQLFDTVAEIREDINPNLKVDGVLITLANMRTVLAKNSVETIRASYEGNLRIYPEPIPHSVKVKEASSVGMSIFAYEPGGKAAAAYESLVKEVLRDARQRGGQAFEIPVATGRIAGLFTSQATRDDVQREKVQSIPREQIDPFPEHLFHVRDDEAMQNMVESMKTVGIQTHSQFSSDGRDGLWYAVDSVPRGIGQ